MNDRAARYAWKERVGQKYSDTILVAYVMRTPKGKIRLKRIGIRTKDQKEEVVSALPKDDPRYVFENDYKVRKATHETVKRSAKFSRYHDSSARVFYEMD